MASFEVRIDPRVVMTPTALVPLPTVATTDEVFLVGTNNVQDWGVITAELTGDVDRLPPEIFYTEAGDPVATAKSLRLVPSIAEFLPAIKLWWQN